MREWKCGNGGHAYQVHADMRKTAYGNAFAHARPHLRRVAVSANSARERTRRIAVGELRHEHVAAFGKCVSQMAAACICMECTSIRLPNGLQNSQKTKMCKSDQAELQN